MRKIDIVDNNLMTRVYKIKIFQYLDDNEKKMLLNIADYFEYHKNEKIITQGEISYCFYAVITGELNVSIQGENGNQIQVSTIHAGDFFGENGIFTDSQRRTANITPVDNALILRIGRDDFFNFIRMYPKAGVNILMLIVHGLMKRLSTVNKELMNEKEDVIEKIPFFEKNGQ